MSNSFFASIFSWSPKQTDAVSEPENHQVLEFEEENQNARFFVGVDTILSTEQCSYCVEQIKETAGLSDESFDIYYRPVIENLALICQDIGASERYHHAYRFGLIEHSLEVAMYAMRLSQGCVYHPDRNVESIQWMERVFMYAVFCAAMLHDAGKICTNTKWSIRTANGEWIMWSPLIHAVPTENERVEFRAESYKNKVGLNVYLQSSHEVFASSFLLDVIPKAGIEWILQFSNDYCPELWLHFIHALSSDYENGNDIGACVKSADQQSTEDAVKRYHRNLSSNYVDLSDPNLPVHESYREVFREILVSPDSYHLVVNKVAMGKFSHIERFGNLLFVSAKSVIPIVNRRLKEKNIKIPNHQSVYTLLVDHGLSIAAPSNDTLWWVEFFSPNNNNKSREMSYLVFDVATFPGVDILDLRTIGVECVISAKTYGDGVEQLETTAATLKSFPVLYAKLYPPLSSDNSSFDATHQNAESLGEDLGEELEKSTIVEESQSQAESPVRSSLKPAIQELPMKDGAVGVLLQPTKEPTIAPPTQTVSKEEPVQSAQDSNTPIHLTPLKMRNEPSTVLDPQPGINRQAKAKNSKQKTRKANKQNQSADGVLDRKDRFSFGVKKALGLSTTGSKSTGNDNKPQVNDGITPITQAIEEVVQPIEACVIPKTADDIKFKGRDVFSDSVKVTTAPMTIEMDALVLEQLVERKMPLRLSGASYYQGENSAESTKRLYTTWLPYIHALIERDLVKVNCEEAGVFHFEHGLLIIPHVFSELLSDDLFRSLSEVVSNSTCTVLSASGSKMHKVTSMHGLEINGYILGTRKLAQDKKPFDLLKGLSVSD